MRKSVDVDELVIGEKYIQRNPYHHEYEYGEVWYAGPTTNKYGEEVHLFSEKPLPADYDGNTARIGGTIYDDDDIWHGCICR